MVVGLFVIATLSLFPSAFASEPQTAQNDIPSTIGTEPDREDTVWCTGSWNGQSNFAPWLTGIAPIADGGMWETLFGYNTADDTLIPCIGTSFAWNSTGTGLEINITDDAYWSDGVQVNASDVVFSYQLAYNMTRWNADWSKRYHSDLSVAFQAIDNNTVLFALNGTDWNNSRVIENTLSQNIPIVPQHVWEQILDDEGNDVLTGLYVYDWFDTPSAYKVISGPYAPVYHSANDQVVVYQYRDNWWGENLIYDHIPNFNDGGSPPTYIGNYFAGSNQGQSSEFAQGNIDLFAGFYPNINELWEGASVGDPGYYIYSWFNRTAPYESATSSLISMVPNHADSDWGDLFSIKEFRQALAYSINRTPISQDASGGYFQIAESTFIQPLADLQAPYFNNDIADEYDYSYNATAAWDLLDGIAGLEYDAENAHWNWLDDGVNKTVGNWLLISPAWGDVVAVMQAACDGIAEALNITITVAQIDGNTYNARLASGSFEFAMMTSGPRVSQNPLDFLNGYRGPQDLYVNESSWINPTFDDKFSQLETASPAEYDTLLDEMQEILADEQPEIPIMVNCLWYAFSAQYWEGFATADNNYQQLQTTWSTTWFATKTAQFINLRSTGNIPPVDDTGDDTDDTGDDTSGDDDTEPGIPWFGLELFIPLGVISTITIAAYKLKRRR